jgi:hypothetical protein
MRLATIAIPAGDDSIELTVSKLGWTGDGPAGLLANVNRWRGQMQLPAVGPAGLADCTSALEVAGSDATLVDLSGQFSSGSMTPPFASQTMPSGHPPIAADGDLRDSGTNDGDTRSPVSGDTNIDAAGIRLETPTGWQSLPAQGMRKANFVIRDSERVAEVTVTDFRNAPGTSMADPLANANRWLGQLGRSPVGAGDLDALTESIEIDGHSGTIFTLESDAAADRPTGMTVAMVVVDEMVWFFKMLGDRDLVAAEGERFRALLDSVEFK